MGRKPAKEKTILSNVRLTEKERTFLKEYSIKHGSNGSGNMTTAIRRLITKEQEKVNNN